MTRQNKGNIMQDFNMGDIVKYSGHLGSMHLKNQEGIIKKMQGVNIQPLEVGAVRHQKKNINMISCI